MNHRELAHRWVHGELGRKGLLTCSNMTAYEDRIYSYSSVYAMWLDRTDGKELMVVMDKAATTSSQRHLNAINCAIPMGVKVIRTHIKAHFTAYSTVDFDNWGEKLPRILVDNLIDIAKTFTSSRKMSDMSKLAEIQGISNDLNYLFSVRKECKAKEIASRYAYTSKILYHVRRNESAIKLVDVVCGKGTYEQYQKRIAPQLKAEKTRRFVEWFNNHHRTQLRYHEIKALKGTLVNKACEPVEKRILEYEKRNKQELTIIKYLYGEGACGRYTQLKNLKHIQNPETGKRYALEGIYGIPLLKPYSLPSEERNFLYSYLNMGFVYPDFEGFKRSPNKRAWRGRMYQLIELYIDKYNATTLWVSVTLGRKPIESLDAHQLAAYNRIQARFVQWQERERRNEQKRNYEEQQAREERVRMDALRKEKIQSYLEMGVEGARKLWIEKLDNSVQTYSYSSDEFFYHGNVLLRWRNDQMIETSKGIVLTIPQATLIWKFVKACHENEEKFKDSMLITKSGKYRATSYSNDILTAGCHRIAYCEMGRMWNEIQARQ